MCHWPRKVSGVHRIVLSYGYFIFFSLVLFDQSPEPRLVGIIGPLGFLTVPNQMKRRRTVLSVLTVEADRARTSYPNRAWRWKVSLSLPRRCSDQTEAKVQRNPGRSHHLSNTVPIVRHGYGDGWDTGQGWGIHSIKDLFKVEWPWDKNYRKCLGSLFLLKKKKLFFFRKNSPIKNVMQFNY